MLQKKADAVFEGGGVKGIALVGALYYAETIGYSWVNLAGTSAGAIVASLVAAGYSARTIHHIMLGLDYEQFCDPSLLKRVPLIGPALSIAFDMGLYKGQAIEEWLRKLLLAKGIKTFGDLRVPGEKDPRYRYKLQVIASDLTLGRMLVLPGDISAYGQDPDALSVAKAVRMSLSIPYFYEPVIYRYKGGRSFVVDGGVLSNYPVWLFDTPPGELPPWPTFGFRLVDPNENRPHTISGPLTLFSALFSTMMEAHDARYIEEAHFARTIPINTLGIQTTDFDLTKEQQEQLFASGMAAARKFFRTWDFGSYKNRYRRGESAGQNPPIAGGAPKARSNRKRSAGQVRINNKSNKLVFILPER